MNISDIQTFIDRWNISGAAERANYQLFLTELCGILEVPLPEPSTPYETDNAYVFERSVTFDNGDGTTSSGFIDLYKRGCFVLEAKQGTAQQRHEPALSQHVETQRRRRKRGTARRGTTAWDDAMLRARGQAEGYARALPSTEGRPPFLMLVDVGHSIELYAEFTRSGGTYVPFPDPRSHRLFLPDLLVEQNRDLLRRVWTDPVSLDPARRTARVTQEIAARLARLALSLEGSGHCPETVATFLIRCLFTMFAEDVRLLPRNSFTNLLLRVQSRPEHFVPMIESLWKTMQVGGFSIALEETLLRFNGGLFEEATALPLSVDQMALLLEAAQADWRDVEPAIFGTLLERALDPRERHQLGAHYTPRAYVERLVIPTVIDPLREEWSAAQTAAVTLARQGDSSGAVAEVQAFHRRLCEVRVLDPACGSGNFLYVTLEHLKRLEGEVLNTLDSLGVRQTLLEMESITVDPHQLLGIEVNPRAAVITELVLWIGYLQWHFRTRGQVMPPEPVIKNFRTIVCRDAVLTWEETEPLRDESGQPVTRWDGDTMRVHPSTEADVPDETARVPVVRYINAHQAAWPEAEFVVGNPPFIGNWRMRSALGDGYTDAIRAAYPEVPESCDYVMYWWHHAAQLARAGAIRRFGFIATNSLRQTFSRRVVQSHLAAKNPLSLRFAIPDHPWVDSADGAAVRISMTVGAAGAHEGILQTVVTETSGTGEGVEVELAQRKGLIFADLTIGANVAGAQALQANAELSCRGVALHGSGFIVTPDQAHQLGLGRLPGLETHIRQYRNGRDLTARSRGVMVIDLFGLQAEEVRERFPEVYQWVYERVKPERDQNNRATYRENWWVFGEPRANFRPALKGLSRYIATVETAKHRFFVFLDDTILPDNMLVNIAFDDAYYLGVLSSHIHVTWALAAGGTLEDRPRYNKTRCFNTFPFPDATDEQKARIRDLAEALDAHRKRQQALHDKLTLTEMYNVLEKLRRGDSLSSKEQHIHEQGLVTVLRQLHDDLDAAVCEAYGWPPAWTDEDILARLVALNAQRAAEERQGIIRWLRPGFQNPESATQTPMELQVDVPATVERQQAKQSKWPSTLAEQAQATRSALAGLALPATPEDVARCFTRPQVDRVLDLLETLVSLGQARQLEDGKFAA